MHLAPSSTPASRVVTPRLQSIPLPSVTPDLYQPLSSAPSPFPLPPQLSLPLQPLLLHPLLAPGSRAHFDYTRRWVLPHPELSLPATQPPTRYLQIITRDHPWTIEITDPNGGYITVLQVLLGIHDALQFPIEEWKLEIASPERRRSLAKAYQRRMGSGTEDDLRRIDWLGGRTLFDGLRKDDEESSKILLLPSNHDRMDWRLQHTLIVYSAHR
jgi:hypothetical protein